MNKVILITLCMLMSACVKLEIKPKDIVSDSVAAGKDLYRTVKRKKNGTEEREYTHTIPVDAEKSDAEVALECLSYLKELAEAATENSAEIVKESTKVIEDEQTRSIQCTAIVIV